MVKVLPHNFTLYESQRILSPTGEPLAITCSDDLLFIAVEECMIEAYDLRTLEQLAQFRTVSPVAQVAYNRRGDCVVTLEKKHVVSQGFVRVYFKWRGLSADKPMRILMASIQWSIPGQNRIAAEIVELPSDSGSSVSCLACCEYTGRIAVGMGSLLRVFYLEREEREQLRGTTDPNTPSSPSSAIHLSSSPSSPSSPLHLPSPPFPTPGIEILLDIQTNMSSLEMVSIMGDYIAFVSTNEARVVKLSLFQTGTDPIPDYQPHVMGNGEFQVECVVTKVIEPQGKIVKDQNFISWSPSAVWEAEKKAHHKTRSVSHVTSHDITDEHRFPDDITNDVASQDFSHMRSHDRDPSSTTPLVGTLHLESITQTRSEKLRDRATMEVLGPVEYVWGQPLSVSVNQMTHSGRLSTPDCRVLTMLYRRFSAEVVGSVVRSFPGLSRNRRATLPVRVEGKGVGRGVEGGWDGLHTVKLVPTFSEGSSSESDPPQLVGISCFLANRFHGYLYDVHQQCRLLSSFSFMEQSRLASCDGRFLHALSSESVETYTSRAFQAAIGNLPRGSTVIPSVVEGDEVEFEDGELRLERSVYGGVGGKEGEGGGGEGEGRGGGGEGGEEVEKNKNSSVTPEERDAEADASGCEDPTDQCEIGSSDGARHLGTRHLPDIETWLRQPIPPHNLDLTLVSTSKFIGCCYLATSQDYIVVVTKAEVEPQTATGANWLLQSLTLRKAKTEHMWNIYVLQLKSATALFQQFMEFAESMKDTSPPIRQHLLSEGHVLLRRQLLQGGYTSEMLGWLQENCFRLADSLCGYSRWNGIETHASRYFIMSGRPIVDVVRHILSTYTPDHRVAYSVLMTYLNLVLFNHRNAENQMPSLRPLANKVLELYAVHTPSGHMTGHMKNRSDHVICHMISLLLHSWLTGYSNEKALSLLETQLPSTSEKEIYSGHICHAVLCLRAGREEDARQRVSHIPKDPLRKWMENNFQFVVDSTALTLTPLGKLVMCVHEMCLLELLVAMLTRGNMTFDDLCSLLRNGNTQSLAHEIPLKHFLEMIILDRSKRISMDTTTKAVLLLVDVLLARLSTSHAPRPSKSTPFMLYGSRHKWLDNVVPFGGEGELLGLDREKRRRQGQLHDLMQLQAVLCSSHMTETVATRVEELLTETPVKNRTSTEDTEDERGGEREGEGRAEGEVEGEREGEGEDGLFMYRLSLQMISWPHLGRKKEACLLALDNCPIVTVDYCHTMFPNDLDLWAWLLERLLGYTQCDGPLQELYVSLYKEALSHIITLTTPQQFLALLPPTGSVQFFLPFIERSCKLHFSRATSEQLHSSLSQQ